MGYNEAMASVFTMIINGDIPAEFVWKDDRCVAFLSINPLAPGHTLVVPREEVDHWIDLDPDLMAHLTGVAQRIGRALNEIFEPMRIGVMIVGEEVPHTHVHVVPIRSLADLDFSNAAPEPGPDFAENAERIRSALDQPTRS
jgi:histidine triad (HIT) family protein